MSPGQENNPIEGKAGLIDRITLIAKDEVEKNTLLHLRLCPFSQLKVEERVRSLENRFALLTGFMFGSGLIGGAAGAWVFKALGG